MKRLESVNEMKHVNSNSGTARSHANLQIATQLNYTVELEVRDADIVPNVEQKVEAEEVSQVNVVGDVEVDEADPIEPEREPAFLARRAFSNILSISLNDSTGVGESSGRDVVEEERDNKSSCKCAPFC